MSSHSWLIGVVLSLGVVLFLSDSRASAQIGALGGGRGVPNPPIGGQFGLNGGVGLSVFGGFGGAGGPAMRGAPVRPATPAVRLPSPTGGNKPALVDKEMVFDVAADATFTKLQASATGLNYVPARFEDVQVGQRLAVNSAKKDDENKGDDVTGTVVALNATDRKVTLKVAVPADQADEQGKPQPAQTVTIRSAAGKK